MTSPPQTRRRAAIAIAATTLLAAAILRTYPPTEHNFYPRCPIHETFGILCPGCGATRALAALLHGQLTEAWHFNALFVAMLPFLLLFAAVAFYRACTQQKFEWPAVSEATLRAVAAITIAYTITRNLPPL